LIHRVDPQQEPVTGFRAITPECLAYAVAPHPGFSARPDRSTQQGLPSGGLPSRTPDLPSLPGAALLFALDTGSSFQIRYVPSGSLFLEPLGTICSMQ
jgi:hypothetical protein